MRPWAEYLAGQGYAVSAPRLPGHGTTWQEMNKTTWADWRGEVEQAYEALANQVDHVFVCGLSMGGALALRFAADHPHRPPDWSWSTRPSPPTARTSSCCRCSST